MSQWITPSVNIPQRNLSSEMDQIHSSELKWADPYYQLEQKYGPLYNRLQLQNQGESAFGFTDANGNRVPGTIEMGRTATAANRAQDVSDLETLGPRATAANLDANPFLRRSLSLLADQQDQSPILGTLNQQAQDALASGGNLSPQEERDIRENTGAVFADKGLQNTDQSAIAALFNRDAAKRGRLAAGQQFASGVEGLNNTFRDFLGRSAQIDATALPDAWTSIFGRSSAGGGGGNGLTPIGQYTRVFDPYNPYAQDLFSSNQNAAATQAIGNAQNQAATRAAIASIAGGAIKASDRRAKEKIVEVGTVWIPLKVSGWARVPTYEFEYRAGWVPQGLRPVRYEGVMADEVEVFRPDAVTVDPRTGFKQVDYSMLGLEFKEAA